MSHVYSNKPQTVEGPKANIIRVISEIQPDLCVRVIENWIYRLIILLYYIIYSSIMSSNVTQALIAPKSTIIRTSVKISSGNRRSRKAPRMLHNVSSCKKPYEKAVSLDSCLHTLLPLLAT